MREITRHVYADKSYREFCFYLLRFTFIIKKMKNMI